MEQVPGLGLVRAHQSATRWRPRGLLDCRLRYCCRQEPHIRCSVIGVGWVPAATCHRMKFAPGRYWERMPVQQRLTRWRVVARYWRVCWRYVPAPVAACWPVVPRSRAAAPWPKAGRAAQPCASVRIRQTARWRARQYPIYPAAPRHGRTVQGAASWTLANPRFSGSAVAWPNPPPPCLCAGAAAPVRPACPARGRYRCPRHPDRPRCPPARWTTACGSGPRWPAV
jgi:hypothetical protein